MVGATRPKKLQGCHKEVACVGCVHGDAMRKLLPCEFSLLKLNMSLRRKKTGPFGDIVQSTKVDVHK